MTATAKTVLSRIANAWTRRGPQPLAAALAPLGRLVLAERFLPPPYLVAIRFPGVAELADPHGLLLFLVSPANTGPSWRHVRLQADAFNGDGVSLGFVPLEPGPAGVALIAIEAASPAGVADLSPAQAGLVCRALATGLLTERPPISVACNEAVPGYSIAANAGHASHAMRVLLPARSAPPPPPLPTAWALERSWQEGGDTYVEGWIHAFARRVNTLRFEWDTGSAAVPALHMRADLMPHYPMLPDGGAHTGFSTLLPGFRGPLLGAVLDTDEGPVRAEIPIPGSTPAPEDMADRIRAREAELHFINEVNGRRLELMELGGRAPR